MSADNDRSEMRRRAALERLQIAAVAARDEASKVSKHMQDQPLPKDVDEATMEFQNRIDETAKKFGIELLPCTDWESDDV
jgi:hypothetical protein